MIPAMVEYESWLRREATEEGARKAKGELLAILKCTHDRELLRRGGLVLDFINGARLRFDEDDHD